MKTKKILITGSAGFIGMHLSLKLSETYSVIGLDNLNPYYDISLKKDRLKHCGFEISNFELGGKIKSCKNENLSFYFCDISNKNDLDIIFQAEKIDIVIHLAAQAGVRYSITNPESYITNNLVGFYNVLELSKQFNISKFYYASSSSVYGNSSNDILSENDLVDKPVSLYAATKKSNELLAYSYSHLYNLETTGLRFFTVYGPWGRPDMAYFSFTKNIFENQPIKIFNNGLLKRDFTYIDDIIDGILILLENTSQKREIYEIYNIGNSNPISVLEFIENLEKTLGIKAIKNLVEMQQGDVINTSANITKIKKIGYEPSTNLKKGLSLFFEWYKSYYYFD